MAEAITFALAIILFVSGMEIAKWWATGILLLRRVLLNLVTGIAIIVWFETNIILTLGIALLGIVTIGVLETRTRSPFTK